MYSITEEICSKKIFRHHCSTARLMEQAGLQHLDFVIALAKNDRLVGEFAVSYEGVNHFGKWDMGC